ncbi:hypothetical protein LNTAR_09164 [Lentisphaera araneosa HTCC2155]|uniref:Uncharacterized protein n=1 Tax=Lentisphaera araneosa HTCC2155 TaxID=313628 RepID=A6DI74_9BACT|nr:Gfo/Idh/MocA family oxidoreductase [Lentisphaera araneosa]EDM28728.1 hypothetical protein LNTAR_09164 [Lentisphaera araneosa HTCC2155]
MKKIKIALIGLNFGKNIVDQLMTGENTAIFDLVKVCDLDKENLKQVKEQYNIDGTNDFNEILEDPEIEAVGLFTGPSGRASFLDKIITAGKDVMTTKPFELDCEAALQVLDKAESLGRVIHLNSPAPCLPPDMQLAKQWQQKHNLGRAVGCNLTVWCKYREKADGSWYDDPIKCPVPPIFRLGIYLINDLVQIFGEAEQVSVTSSRIFTERPTADNANLTILFKNGAIANIFASFCINDGDAYKNSMTLNFENGTVYRNVGVKQSPGMENAELGLIMGNFEKGRTIVEEEFIPVCSGQYQWDNFAKAIRGENISSELKAEDIVASLRIIEAMSLADQNNGHAKVKAVLA